MGFRESLREKIMVFDGAMGTSVQVAAPDADAYQGHDGLNDWLTLSRPDVIRDIHASFLDAGCDVIETNSFGAFPVVLDEYGLGDRSHELCRASAELARGVADDYASTGQPRYVAGSIGPGTKLPSLGHITLNDLIAAFEPMCRGLVAGGCDLLLIETCQDLLQTRAALFAARRAFAAEGRTLPVGLQITVENTGTMLTGTETRAALATLLPLHPDFVGLNCATGPRAMRDHVRTLCRYSPVPVSVIPNAGMPKNVDGEMVYDLSPEVFAETLGGYVREFGVGIVGGCCGTRPAHLKALVDNLAGVAVTARDPEPLSALASLYDAVDLDQKPRPLLVGERTNANGSKKFRDLQAAEDLESMVAMAVQQQEEGAHILDVSVAYVGRDEAADMSAFAQRLNTECRLPVMIDSTSPEAIEAALQQLAGRCIVNSVNLEDGEPRARTILELCARYGAAVVALCIDEKGMALTPEHKLEVAQRLVALAAEYGMTPADMLIDPLTFTLASGDPDYRDSALNTLEGIRRIKASIPGARCLLGLSNVSFGLKARTRRILNSVFLQKALAAGLDAAILHAGKILSPADIPSDLAAAAERLIADDTEDGDPLEILLQAQPLPLDDARAIEDMDTDAQLRLAVIRGSASGLTVVLDEALQERTALAIINHVLLDAMREVGDLFGAGLMQLPFVLKSAAVMKAAVDHLEPHLDRTDASARGSIVMATVKGDVHDIGKNLVGIILGNNGYDVFDIGVKAPIDRMIESIKANRPDALGMSGLLVKSTIVMKENLEALNAAGIDLPVILGGAALTRRYVEADLRRVYKGRVYYARDAFAGLQLLELISRDEAPEAPPREETAAVADGDSDEDVISPVLDEAPVPEPPFWGTRVESDIPLADIWHYLNRPALFKSRWGYSRAGMDAAAYRKLETEEILPALASLQSDAIQSGWLEPKIVRGYFPVRADGERLHVYKTPQDETPAWHFDFPRQQKKGNRCLTDYFLKGEDGRRDILALFAVTVGPRATEHAAAILGESDFQKYLLVHGLSVETAEALAEYCHARIRRELGIHADDDANMTRLIRGGYQGRRYSFGYAACPDLDDQRLLERILDWSRIGLELTDECLLVPEQSVSALVIHHPQAEYFSA
jgi:5-methyltetrahydrofolate--homocysteine methyltransferase